VTVTCHEDFRIFEITAVGVSVHTEIQISGGRFPFPLFSAFCPSPKNS